MPSPDDLDALVPAMTAWRRDIHAHPELGFEERRTAALVAEELRAAGIEVAEGLATTGVVGTLRGRGGSGGGNRAIGLRADMDALAMAEVTGLPYASTVPGKMHACGHDGHTAMLLGAAKWLAANPDRFSGTVHFIFQPAEESLGGADVMVKEGLFDRFPVDAVYGMHNMLDQELGSIAVPKDRALASSDTWEATFTGKGGHGARPHLATDAPLAAAQFITALHSIVARQVDPLQSAVVSVGHIAAGDAKAPNVIPSKVFVNGTARAFRPEERAMLAERIPAIARSIAATFGVEVEARYHHRTPPTINHAEQVQVALRAAAATVGPDATIDDPEPITPGEDFAFMLNARPGAYVFLGMGPPAHPEGYQHNPHYDFNDAVLKHGAAFWCSLVETELS
ncbi:M20 family metallopeptidase [Roseomonas sp. OT10]|uniref:M20 aminoacylase family protein n=1 Tax=Roseomonas cutis TaxID=2897332 RepID=UPI001E4208F3|nr:M20 aminoacylase family protein [Roseomonas sp. OT10]UFN51106.1 M20 family metallopeptidase [Roseomonas sp. OT10]